MIKGISFDVATGYIVGSVLGKMKEALIATRRHTGGWRLPSLDAPISAEGLKQGEY